MQVDTGFDFDYWLELAESDAEAFESKRRETIEELIRSMPKRHHRRLRQLQWKIDAVRDVSPNPLASCVRISTMLIDHTYGEGGLLDSLNALVRPNPSAIVDSPPKPIGKVLKFRTRNSDTVN